MAKHLTRLAAAAALMAVCGGHGASAASGTDAEQATATLRAVYAGPDPYGVFKLRDRRVLGRVLTPALVETWAGPEADGPQSDGSPIAWSQMTDSVRLVTITPRGFSEDRGTLDATVDAVVEGGHVTKRLSWDMKKIGGRWLADDIHSAGSSFRAVFATFAPAVTPVPPHAAARPPIRIGDYKTAADTTCWGMSYWSNRAGSGFLNSEDGSSIAGWNCGAETYSHSGGTWTLHGVCSTGAGGHVPERRGSLKVRIVDETSFVHAGQLYNWCGPGSSAR